MTEATSNFYIAVVYMSRVISRTCHGYFVYVVSHFSEVTGVPGTISASLLNCVRAPGMGCFAIQLVTQRPRPVAYSLDCRVAERMGGGRDAPPQLIPTEILGC